LAFQYGFGKKTNKSISNLDNLLDVLDITHSQYYDMKSLAQEDRYTKSFIAKQSGNDRVVYNPHKYIRRIQRRINRRIFNQRHNKGGLISWPSYLFGSIPNNPQKEHLEIKDYVACAAMHCESQSVMKMDIADFFDNIHEEHVLHIFRKLLYFPESVSKVLTDICCHEGSVIQGALTSSYIASAVMFDLEPALVKKLHAKKLTYTRLVDDITISSNKFGYNFSYAKNQIIDMLSKKGLPTNDQKTEILNTSSSELLVHGLRINFKEPRLPSKEVGKIRANVKHVETFAQDGVFRTSREYRGLYNKALGRVNRLQRLGHNQHSTLLERLLRIKPKPSKADIKKVSNLVRKIEELHLKYNDSYRYSKLYYKAQAELNILQRTFFETSNRLRLRLKGIKPRYEK